MKERSRKRVCGESLHTQAVFVPHVRNGYEERKIHIENMLDKMGIKFEYILEGDIGDITQHVAETYFTGNEMTNDRPQTSCALKHIIAYQTIMERGLDGALILEDDIKLHRSFISVFNKSIKELGTDYPEDIPIIISYEDTRLRFVPRSIRKKGKVLYKGDRDRMTGAYYVNAPGAHLIIEYARTNKIDRPIDLIHNKLLQDGALTYLWCQPTIASQGSASGQYISSISSSKRAFTPIIWKFKSLYKKILYLLR